MGWFRDLGRDKPWAQGCVIAGAGCVISATGCFGFILSANFTAELAQTIGLVLGGVFVLGLLVLPVGFVWSLVGLGRTVRARSDSPPPGPPPPQS
jgi:hypothetical protein